ncbi:transcription initiation factor TFIIA large subunit [Scheffersomyces amazonensis]|uniref:transcription initiation factor TFIIA large subunit n=1 Tax=Scheffersomyces amazonensis TaxID=1078765 RepID=UPI00315DF1AA
MSNFEARKLFENIVEDVINDSRQDFEDSGIDESTLQELRRIWCERLSQSQVAKFSWDDEEPEEPPSVSVGGGLNYPLVSNKSDIVGGGGGGGGLNTPDDTSNGNVLSYGNVTDSIGLELSKPEVDEDNSTGLLLPKINQADGTVEFTMYSETSKAKELIHKLKQNSNNQQRINQTDGTFGDDDDGDDDIFNDSDDINSDLDDDLESDKSDGESGEQEGQLMLCLYDRVQRIKNKWKFNLKEGIANIDGRDYVFHKATGESEW